MTPAQRERLEPDDLSALWYACKSTDTGRLAELIKILDPPIEDLAPGLWYAIEDGNVVMMRYLLDRGMFVDESAICQALQARSITTLEILREYGWEDVNMNMASGSAQAYTALSHAVHDPSLVSYLLARGADPNLASEGPGTFSSPSGRDLIPNSGSILRAALRYESLESFNLLLAHGHIPANAKLMHSATEGGHASAMARVLELGGDIEERDDLRITGVPTYKTPLLRAIKTGKAAAVQFLLDRGADVMSAGYDGWTPLEVVKKKCCDGSSLCIVHGQEILPEIKDMVIMAVERRRVGGVGETRDGTNTWTKL